MKKFRIKEVANNVVTIMVFTGVGDESVEIQCSLEGKDLDGLLDQLDSHARTVIRKKEKDSLAVLSTLLGVEYEIKPNPKKDK